MTSIKIGDALYEVTESIAGASLRDLKYLGRETSGSKDFPKVTIKSMQEMFTSMGELAASDGSTLDLLADDAFLANMIGVIWLARRKAGEDLTYEQAGEVSFSDVSFVNDDDDEDEAPKGEAVEPADLA
jgi:hypothetical protein